MALVPPCFVPSLAPKIGITASFSPCASFPALLTHMVIPAFPLVLFVVSYCFQFYNLAQ
eukprot:JP445195.1.p1 GENE.JP445195.1~~JP445195.1.p1  ORF type:complete len:59 (+),score=1.51 JP445195.1:43-219(+)